MLLKAAFDILKPWPMVFLVDHVLQNNSGNANQAHLIGWCVAATVLFFLLSWAAALANTYASVSLGQRMNL